MACMSNADTAVPVTVPFNGRELSVLPPDLGQMALLEHQARVLQRDGVTANDARRALDLAYRIVRGRLANEDDKVYVEDLLADGDVGLLDLVKLVAESFKASVKAEEPAKPVVRRGRPRKQA